MPVALAAAQMYSNWLGLGALQWRAEDYISFVCKFMLGMGLGFELPVVILTLVKIGVLDYGMLSEGAPLHDCHQSDSRRGADDAGTHHPARHVCAAAIALRNDRLDCVVLGPAGPGQGAPRAFAGAASFSCWPPPGVARLEIHACRWRNGIFIDDAAFGSV
jgi:hypothetical protein